MMIRFFVVLLVWTRCAAVHASLILPVVQVDELKLIGDPLTLTSMNKLSLSEHEAMFHRWKIKASLEQVMSTLSRQVPSDTIAWSDGDVMRMVWAFTERSQMLIFFQIKENCVEFFLSTIHLNRNNHAKSIDFKKSSKIPERSIGSFQIFKKVLHELPLNAEPLMDVRDASGGVDARSLLYAIHMSLEFVESTLRQSLKKYHWLVNEAQQNNTLLNQTKSMTAEHAGNHLHINLVPYFGLTYLYVNFSGAQ